MSQSDDPFDRNGKTVIRPRPGGTPPQNDRFGSDFRPVPPGQNTIISPGFLNPEAGRPAPQAPASDTWRGGGGNDALPGDWMSPEFPAPAQPAAPRTDRRRIPLGVALGARANVGIRSSNPITQAAAPLLILLGRLRQMIVETDAVPLMQHVARSIQDFEKTVLAAGVPEDQATIAKYALCATADDIVQNLPDTQKHVWLQYSMLAQFFGVRTSGTGFFDKVRQLSSNPTVYYNLLELIHACLSLGFEGQYRSTRGGDIELQRVRRDVFTTLRAVRPVAAADISPRWRGVTLGVKGLADGIPLWAIASVLLAVLAGLYMLLRIFIGGEADEVADTLVHFHPGGPVEISRATFVPMPPPAPTQATLTQLQRIRGVLAPEIEQQLVGVDPAGESIVIRISNLLLFDSGQADVKPAFAALARRIGEALDKEPGNIRVVGHTDNVRPKASSRFKSNYDLSVKRAQSVAGILMGHLQNKQRLEVSGKGEDEPVTSNATREGQAQNRRVELAIPKEESISN